MGYLLYYSFFIFILISWSYSYGQEKVTYTEWIKDSVRTEPRVIDRSKYPNMLVLQLNANSQVTVYRNKKTLSKLAIKDSLQIGRIIEMQREMHGDTSFVVKCSKQAKYSDVRRLVGVMEKYNVKRFPFSTF